MSATRSLRIPAEAASSSSARRRKGQRTASAPFFQRGNRGRLPKSSSGWPGDRALSSIEWQARELWDELLTQFAGFAWIVPRIAAAEAVASLNALARDHIFQPQSAAVPIQILGVLEAAGLPFDALWIAGLASDVWPAAPRPNPLLPLAWQRERNAPRATPALRAAPSE